MPVTTIIKSSPRNSLIQDETFPYNITRYPLNLGSRGRSHYIVFHVLEQRKSQYKTDVVSGDNGVTNFEKEKSREIVAAGRQATSFGGLVVPPLLNAIQSTVDGSFQSVSALLPEEAKEIVTGLVKEGGNAISETINDSGKLGFLRTVTKTSETIALYMPDTLNFVQGQGYSDLELGNSFVTALFAGGSSVADSINLYNNGDRSPASARVLGGNLAKNLSPFLVNKALGALGNIGRATAAAGQGIVTNPMIEVLYTSPNLRSFRFDFVFYPESSTEAKAVQKIIDLFQFHQAPEIAPGTGGYFLVPPSEFDIEFYYAGYENVNLPKISTCVLTNLDVDYAPNGWSAYEIPGQFAQRGGSGMPVGIRLSLEFKETSIVTKASRQFDRSPISKSSQTFPLKNR